MSKTQQDPPPVELPFLQHLIELRDRMMRVVLVVIVVFLCLFSFANDIYSYLAEPLMRHLPDDASMIATEVASPFLTPFKLTLVLSMFIAVPVILYHFWAFIAPGMYKKERRLIYPLMLSSTLLFFLGMAFAYYVVFPLVFGFLIGMAPEGVSVMTDITKYLDFVLKMFFAFGIAFEVPIATILVVWSGMTTAEELAKKRPYIIVGAFVFGMLLTPPDVISQTLLAFPMWILFELGLIFSRWYTKPEEEEGDSDDGSEPPDKPSPAGASEATASETIIVNGTTVTTTEDGATTFSTGNSEVGQAEGGLSEVEMDAELDRIEKEDALEEIQNTILAPSTDWVEESEVNDPTAPARELLNDGIDDEAHASATAEAEAFARAAAGDIGDYRKRVYETKEEPQVLTEEDHDRITADASVTAPAAEGIADTDASQQGNPDTDTDTESDTLKPDDTK